MNKKEVNKRYHEKKKDYRNAHKRLKYNLFKGKITQKEFDKEFNLLRKKYNIKIINKK